ncbi:hypothetical protein [Dysgonomonas sp. ZJ279]|uniref:hypothetical protein n=1 Tax=Dysgonomonas sp. ZJ279 TaxID=2709796 RepID=UPI0013EBC3B5|nr:hypothetical protein [Dysgonomonas sp. ZJ279]
MKRILIILSAMLLFMNMTAQVQLGNVSLKNVSSFEIDENILEMSNTAKIVIPRNYAKLKDKAILEQIHAGDKVTLDVGYDGDYKREFTGYIREIESDIPLVIHCDDETYPLRQTNFIKSYKDATLKQVLADIIPSDIKYDCPDVRIGKYQIDNASAFAVLQDLMKHYGLYSSLQEGKIKVGLAYDFAENTATHIYTINAPADRPYQKNVRKNDLKFKRKEDFKVRYKAIAHNGKIKGKTKNTVVIVGNKEKDASERTLNFAGPMTEAELRERANAVMAKTVYDGYTGDITGFGLPRTHAGDSLELRDSLEPERAGRYLIEKVNISYSSSSGFSRKNTLSYKV